MFRTLRCILYIGSEILCLLRAPILKFVKNLLFQFTQNKSDGAVRFRTGTVKDSKIWGE